MADVKWRYRVNVSTTVKGVKTYDCTVDIEGLSMEDVVKSSDLLVTMLDERYGLVKQLDKAEALAAELRKVVAE